MPLKQLPSDKKLEELIQIVEAVPEFTQKGEETLEELIDGVPNDITGFLSFFHIKHGPNVIRVRLLYHLYRHWSKNPVSDKKFRIEINKYLIPQTIDNAHYYLLNQQAFSLSKKSYDLLNKQVFNKTKSPYFKKHFENFLTKHDIQPGSYWVESYLLFYIYDRWAYSIRKKLPLGNKQFYAFCKLYFKHRRRTENRTEWFAVSESVRKYLPEETVAQIKEGRKARPSNQKRQSKKPSKIRGTET